MKTSFKKICWLMVIAIMGIISFKYYQSTGNVEIDSLQEQSLSHDTLQTRNQDSGQVDSSLKETVDIKTSTQTLHRESAPSAAHSNQNRPSNISGNHQKHRKLANESMADDDYINRDQYYYTKEDVMAYLHHFGHLPDNYITKSQAAQEDWSPEDQTYVIGGDHFGNRERRLPTKQGRQYYEADVQAGYKGNRGPERIVYSNDGLIFYTDDHYDSFQQYY